MPSDTQHHRIRGLATLRRLGQDVRSAFSRHPQATLNASGSGPASSIYAERLLSGNHIRVLHILPSSKRSRRLECELKLINLDDAPVYEALSYVWGIGPPSVPIKCNSQRLNIRPELSYALVRLRLNHATRIIWADALCINQDDNEEKSHQVPLMRKIFSQATKVNVWLGRGDESVIKEAFECCRLVANACRECSLEHDMNLDDDETHEAVEISITVFTVKVCGGLKELFTRPLFTRVWCVQEVLLARDALVIWGEHELPWKDVGLTTSWIVSKWDACKVDGELESLLATIDVEEVNSMYTFDHAGASLLKTLSDFRDFQSTDPRDKVYGLIGLVGNEPEIGSIILDYEKSVADVYAETALHSLTITQHLQVFAHISHDADYDGSNEYQSWAPRWDCPQNTSTIDNGYRVSVDGACSGREAQILGTRDSKRRQLCLTGITYAAVTKLDSLFAYESLTEPGGFRRHNQVAEIYENSDWDDPESVMTLRTLARTLSTGYTIDYVSLKRLDSKSICAHYENFRRFSEWWQTPKANSNDLRGDTLRYQSNLIARCHNRCLFLTSKDDYGIGPACMREGDIVAVLYGGNAPFVLRPKGDEYLMLGETYVDSIMNGELVKQVKEGKRQEQEFCLI